MGCELMRGAFYRRRSSCAVKPSVRSPGKRRRRAPSTNAERPEGASIGAGSKLGVAREDVRHDSLVFLLLEAARRSTGGSLPAPATPPPAPGRTPARGPAARWPRASPGSGSRGSCGGSPCRCRAHPAGRDRSGRAQRAAGKGRLRPGAPPGSRGGAGFPRAAAGAGARDPSRPTAGNAHERSPRRTCLPGAAARSTSVSPGGSRSGRTWEPMSCTKKWPAAKSGDRMALPETTVSASGAISDVSVRIPSERRAAASESRLVRRGLAVRSRLGGRLSASRMRRVASSPKRVNHLSTRKEGWEK